MEFPSIYLSDSQQLDYFHREHGKVLQEYYVAKRFAQEQYVPMISYHNFSSIFKFVKKEPSLEDKWISMVKQIMSHAGFEFTTLEKFENKVIIPYPFYYIPEAKNLAREIRELREKILHYKYLKFSVSLMIFLKNQEFAKEWQEFFTLVKLFADEEDLKAMGA